MTQIFKPNKHGYNVLTPSGFQDFAGISIMGTMPTLKMEFEMSIQIECTYDHKFYVDLDHKVEASQIEVGDTVFTSAGDLKLIKKTPVTGSKLVYDLIEVSGGHKYFTNGILSSNCEFLIFDETLVNSAKLLELAGTDPVERQGQVRWYHKPKKGSTFLVSLDPSLGTGGDPAAIQVFELPEFRQIAEWQHNKTPVQQQIKLLKSICQTLHETTESDTDIYYSVENNTLGEAALICISELGEENIHGIFMSEPRKSGQARSFRKGFNTTNRSKIAACAKLKNYIESGRMTISSKNLISELKNFVAHGTSFAAKTGETDDLVMATLLIVRMVEVVVGYDATLDQQFKGDQDEDFIEPLPFIMI